MKQNNLSNTKTTQISLMDRKKGSTETTKTRNMIGGGSTVRKTTDKRTNAHAVKNVTGYGTKRTIM
jgi:hypothetical protein